MLKTSGVPDLRKPLKSLYKTIQPMQPSIMKEKPENGWIYEPKYDGTRTLAFITPEGVRFKNRRNIDTTYRYPELKDLHVKVKADKGAILDGEIVVFKGGKSDFKALAEREHLANLEDINKKAHETPVTFVAFDILWLDGKDLRDKPFSERRKILNSIITEGEDIKLMPECKTLKECLKRIKGKEEGIVAKNVKSKYVEGRNPAWQKLKARNTIDAVILGYTPGEGKRKGLIGSFVLGAYDESGNLKYIGRAGSGFSDKELSRILKELKHSDKPKTLKDKIPEEGKVKWVKPDKVVRVEFTKWTPHNIMREPRLIEERKDIHPKQADLERRVSYA